MSGNAGRQVRFSAAMSLDGFIAGPHGESDWIVMDPDIDFMTMMKRFDTILMGRVTYEAARGKAGGGGGMPGMRSYVFSRTLGPGDCPGVTVSNDPSGTLRNLKGSAGKDIWLFGGGGLLRSLLDQNLVDSIELAIIPVMLGQGIPLRPQPASLMKLKLTGHRVYEKTGTVLLEYAPR